ncbi:hypothetical protein [Belliella pelovolcani]|uniref:hypothetical protein n=1 Tax=Belliella pelovolcani TaxID=529505 RepID=UPI00391A282A
MMNLEKLGLNPEDVLQRSQLARIRGGNEGGECCVHYRSTDDNHYMGQNCGFSVSEAQGWYHMESETAEGDAYVSGYCCASC